MALCLLGDDPCDIVRGLLGLVGAADTVLRLRIYQAAGHATSHPDVAGESQGLPRVVLRQRVGA
jgi:hypothetical protein